MRTKNNDCPEALLAAVDTPTAKGIVGNAVSVVEEERPMKQGMSLNDLFTTVEAESLAEKLGKSPIDDLKKAIALNQKFLFINELFNGQEPSYQEAIAEINAMPSLEDAWNYLQLNHQASEWNREDEAVEQFAVLLQRRFMPS